MSIRLPYMFGRETTAILGTMTQQRPDTILSALDLLAAGATGRLAAAFADGGDELFLVGGVVRDVLLNRVAGGVLDLDFTTSALPERTQRYGQTAGAASIYLVGERFGTVGLVFDAEPAGEPNDGRERVHVEITTYRAEQYLDGTRHPVVVLGGSLHDDLARRDFTINAIAADARTGDLVDPFGGQADIDLAVIRAVGDPVARFEEDPLRLLRAARFVSQLGFRIDPETQAAIVQTAPGLARISRERILMELSKLLMGDYVSAGLAMLRATGLLDQALPELVPLAQATTDEHGYGRGRGGVAREKDLWAHTCQVVGQAPPRLHVRWAAVLHDAAKPLCRTVDERGEVHFFGHEQESARLAERLLRRLGADKAMITAVVRLVELHARPEAYEPDWTDSAVRRLALEAGDDLHDLLDLAAADVTSAREHRRRVAVERVEALRRHVDRLEAEHALAQLQSPLDGNELMAMVDRRPGRWIAEIKDALREMVIDGDLGPDDKAGAARVAQEMIKRL